MFVVIYFLKREIQMSATHNMTLVALGERKSKVALGTETRARPLRTTYKKKKEKKKKRRRVPGWRAKGSHCVIPTLILSQTLTLPWGPLRRASKIKQCPVPQALEDGPQDLLVLVVSKKEY